MIALMTIGFLIYGPVMLIGLFALELVPEKAAGTAAGLTGLFWMGRWFYFIDCWMYLCNFTAYFDTQT